MRRQIAILSVAAAFLIVRPAVFAAPPVLEVSPTYFEFTANEGGANPADQILSIWRGGGNGPLNWEVTEDCNWIVVEPNSGKSMGEVDDVNVIVDISGLSAGSYNCELTVTGKGAAQSPQTVNVNLVIYKPNPLAHWKFDEGEGGIAYDSVGSNHGTVYGAVWTTGQIEGALSFDGNGDYVDCGNNDSLNVDSITISAWINSNVLSGSGVRNKTIVCKRDVDLTNPTAYELVQAKADYSKLVFAFNSNGSWHSWTTNDSVMVSGWMHVVVTYNGTSHPVFYVNGVVKANNEGGSLANLPSNTAPVYIGAEDAGGIGGYFNGTIDDVRIYDRSLSAGEILQLFGEGLGGRAFNPNPADGATGVEPDVILSWSPGYQVASHDVYLGTDYNDVNDANIGSPEYMGNFDVNNYDPCGLDLMTTYYWRIDEVNDSNLCKGDVWSFETTMPVIELSATQFEFYAIEGGANPDGQILSISNSGFGTLNWEITDECSWLSAEPNSGSSTGEADEVVLSVDISGLALGLHTCNLTISDPNASNNPQMAGVTLHVGDYDGTLYVPSEYSTIQAAMDVALNGNVVIVASGTYTGAGNRDLDFGGKAITVRSTDPNDPAVVAATVIDCESAFQHRGFYFHNGEGPNSIVSGFTIKRGYVYNRKGGGIYCSGSSPAIKNCTITNNRAQGSDYAGSYIGHSYGGGISCTSSSHPAFINCTISNNTARGGDGSSGYDGGNARGGGIYSDSDSNLTIINCVITDNTARGGNGGSEYEYPGDGGSAYGGGTCIYGELTIVNCIIADNTARAGSPGDTEIGWAGYGEPYGGGIYCGPDNNPTIRNCTITGNEILAYQSVNYYGAGICSDGGTTTILSSIIWGNYGYEIYGSGFNISYSDIEGGYGGTGNIDSDPCFIEPANSNYHLNPYSPCINTGDPSYSPAPGETDIDGEPRVMGVRVDIGADEVDVEAGVPIIELSSTAFVFCAYEGSTNPEDQILSIRNIGTGTLMWEITEDCNWLSVEPNNGSSTGEFDDVNLSVDISGLPIAIYYCNLTVDANSSNSPQTVAIELHVSRDFLHVPSEYGTIQEAIDVAIDGSIVIVEPNVYTGSGNRDLDFGGKAITVRSIDPNDPNIVAVTLIDCENVNGHRGFYFHSGEGPNSIVLGLTIKRGRLYSNGGGIYCDGASPTIKNCTITANRVLYARGGGIYCTSSSHPAIINCTISNNTARGSNGVPGTSFVPAGDGGLGYGGGIYCSSGSSATVINCVVNNNTARGGNGGDEGAYGGPGQGGRAYGGGIYGSVTISDSIVRDNLARGGGSGPPGGALPPEAYGGGIYGNSTVDNCLIINNTADNADGENWLYYGGGICASSVTITNSTICNNTAYDSGVGGGVYCSSSGTIKDSIIWGNGDDLYGCSATYSCIEDGDAGTGNISADPCFVTGPGGDYYLSQIAAGQDCNSPCVDAGSDTAANLWMDIFTTRTDQITEKAIVDMGYHYFMVESADIDRDGDVDMADYAILASQWQQTTGIPSADIAPPGGDGGVDEKDLALLVDNWLWEKQ